MKQVHLFVAGLVQGVCFRYFVQEKALDLGLSGFVRNLADGRVEVLAEGSEDKLKVLADLVKRGPDLAQVTGVEEQWGEAQNNWKGFGIHG